jgi:hypothetical protein
MNGKTKQKWIEKAVRKLNHLSPTSLRFGQKPRPRTKAPSATQRHEQIGERLAMILVTSFVVIWLVLVLMALGRATTSDELFDVAGRLLPILVALLAPILHHYFGRERNDKDP